MFITAEIGVSFRHPMLNGEVAFPCKHRADKMASGC